MDKQFTFILKEDMAYMYNKTIISLLLILIVLGTISIILNFQNINLNNKLLENNNSNFKNTQYMENKNYDSLKQIIELMENKEDNNLTNNLDKIEQQESDCISTIATANLPNCAYKAQKSLEDEMNLILKQIESELTSQKFSSIKNNQITWEKQIKEDKKIIDKFIFERPGTFNQVMAIDEYNNILKSRISMLNSLLNNIKEEKELTDVKKG